MKGGGAAAGWLEFGWIYRWIGSGRCRRVWLGVVDFFLSHQYKFDAAIVFYVVGDRSILRWFCKLSREGKENDEIRSLMFAVRIKKTK